MSDSEPQDLTSLYALANSLGVAAAVTGDAEMAKRARDLYAECKRAETARQEATGEKGSLPQSQPPL